MTGFGIFECGGGGSGSQSVRFFGGFCSFPGSFTLLTHAVAEEGEAAEVVEQVAQADLQPGADFADGADEVGLITPALVPENVFDSRPDAALAAVALFLAGAQRGVAVGSFVDLALDAQIAEGGFDGFAAIGAVGVEGDAGVAFVEQFAEGLAVVDAGRGDGVALDELGGGIDFEVVFVAVMFLAVFLGVAGVGVFLPLQGGFGAPGGGDLTGLELFVFLAGVVLAGDIDETGVDDFAGFQEQAVLVEQAFEGGEEGFEPFGSEAFAEFPNRLGVGDAAFVLKTQKALEAGAIKNLMLALVIAQGVGFLEDEDFEHQDDVVGWTAALRGNFSGSDFVIEILLEHGPERFPVDALVEAVQCGELARDFLAALAVREESADGVIMLAFGHPGRCLRWEHFQVLHRISWVDEQNRGWCLMDKSLTSTRQASPMDVALHYQRLLGLPEPWVVTELVENLAAQSIELHLSHDAKSRFACPHCQQLCPVYDHAHDRRWRHLDALQFRTFLTTRPPRINCAKHGICNVDLPWAQFHSRWTIDVEFRAIEVLQACSSITAACKLLQMSWNMLQGIMKFAVEKGLERRSLKELRLLGLDEKSFLRGQSYISVCTDLEGRRVLEVSPGRTAEEAMVALEVVPLAQREKIAAVAMDLSEACAKAVRNFFPKAAQVIDRYHVSALLNKALNAVRQSEHARLLRQGDDVLKGTRQLWLYGPENMSDAMLLRFEAIAEMNLQTSKAWQVKENFAGFWEQPNAEIGARYFANWSAAALRLKLGPVSKVVKTLSHYLTGLLSYFVHRITNAMSEGFNSKIQSLKSAARGFRSFANYRIRILFFCGRLDMGRTPSTAS